MIIAIDGHSSCGKSTIAKALAKKLHYTYIDTGAMYRAITYFCLQQKLIEDMVINENELQKQLQNIDILFVVNPNSQLQETFINGVNIEHEIRGLEVANLVSSVSKLAFVRHKLVAMQQEYGKNGNIIMDGRDIGTVVFPNADYKFFVTASAQIRAQRRFDELQAKGENVDFSDVLANIEQRDYLDSTRAESPLKQAHDAILIDTSYMTREEQLQWIQNKINE